MSNAEIRIGGFGGQGVIMSAAIIGKAASIFDQKHATMIQSFGPEARGSSCSASVVISDQEIAYPYVKHPNVLVVMSQESFTKFAPTLVPGGVLIVEEDLVQLDRVPKNVTLFTIPATRFAEELGKRLVTNIVMTGFFTAVSQLISHEAMRSSVLDSIPKGTEEMNVKAFEKGYAYGMEVMKEREGK